MTPEKTRKIENALKNAVFSLSWRNETGHLTHGTGFFISEDGLALTAYHNVAPHLAESPDERIAGQFRGTGVEFRLALPNVGDLEWQAKHDIAILRAEPCPDGVKPLRCFFLNAEAETRGKAWAGDEVAILGYPASAGFAQILLTGRVNSAVPLRDHHVLTSAGAVLYDLHDAIQIVPNHPEELSGLAGMSGAPVYDARYGGVIGMVVAVGGQVAAIDLRPCSERWPEGKNRLTRLPISYPPARSAAWLAAVLALILVAGFLAWLVYSPKERHLDVDVIRVATNQREPLKKETRFAAGEKVRFVLTSPVAGHLYVVDQEVDRSGKAALPYLIFPTAKTGLGRNRVSAGVPVQFPAEDEDPSFIEPAPLSPNDDYGGELLTVLVFSNPLKLELKDHPILLDSNQVSLDGMKPRLFTQPKSAIGTAIATCSIRVTVQ